LLEQIKDFEEREFAGARGRETDFKARLQPLNESGGAALLQMVRHFFHGFVLYCVLCYYVDV